MSVSNVSETNNGQKASDIINLTVPPILILVGVTCNIFVVLTMRTRYFRSISTSVYLRAGAFNDILALLISLTTHWLYVNFPYSYVRTEHSHIICKFLNFYGPSNTDLGILITTVMTAERAIVIVAPFGAAKCSPKKAWIAVSVTITFVILKNFHFILSSDIVPIERRDRLCDVKVISESYSVFWLDVWPWLNLAFYIICGFALLVNNCLILHRVKKSAADKYSGGQKWRQLAPMLLGESLLLIILTFPLSFHLALLAIRLKYNPDLYHDPDTAAKENLIFSITFYMLYSNKCANFLMYCVTGSKFREGLRMTFMTCFCRKEKWRRQKRSTMYLSTISKSTYLKPSSIKNGLKENLNRRSSEESLSDSVSSCSNEEPEVDVEERTQPSVSTYI